MTNKLVIGNWKLNGSFAANEALLGTLVGAPEMAGVSCGVCVPYPYLSQARQILKGSPVLLGAQNVSEFTAGAYTGEVSAGMLAELGCFYVIVGHSERRALFAESDVQVGHKVSVALSAGLCPVLCVGETLAEREQGMAVETVVRQLDAVAGIVGRDALSRCVIAYEPVWAIGTGRTASVEQVIEIHGEIRAWLDKEANFPRDIKVLYGGSVKPDNAAVLFAADNVDGGLIGGASLVAEDFLTICRAAADCVVC